MFSKREDKYKGCLKRIFNSADGKFILKVWHEDYVVPSAISDNATSTAYNLALKEWVIALKEYLDNPEDLNDIVTDEIRSE